jgi:hypothetical protein
MISMMRTLRKYMIDIAKLSGLCKAAMQQSHPQARRVLGTWNGCIERASISIE